MSISFENQRRTSAVQRPKIYFLLTVQSTEIQASFSDGAAAGRMDRELL